MFSLIQSVTLTIALAFFLRFFVVQPFIVEGSSMEPNFHDREYIVIDKASYRFREPHRGEVIVFHPPNDPSQNYIKRIIGLPGDTVEIKEEDVYINNKKVDEPYLGESNHATNDGHQKAPITLAAGEYFVLGDNRQHSSDSREWGILDKASIEGRTWFIAYPPQNFQLVTPPTYQAIM
jgi:signal peptidase I